MMLVKFMCLLLLTAIASNALADTILYDEAISGDLTPMSAVNHNLNETLSVFVLQPGLNRVFGEMTYKGAANLVWDIDSFAVTVPTGFELTAIGFDASRTTGKATSFTMAISPGIVFNNSNIDIPPRPPILGTITAPIPSEGVSSIPANVFPLGPGNYALSFDQGTLLDGEFQSNPFRWGARLNVTAVPEPTSILILGVCTFGLAVRRKRTRVVTD